VSDEKLNADAPQAEDSIEYQAPAIEEVVNREGLEREVAYAGFSSLVG
jgi:hypothetical protein